MTTAFLRSIRRVALATFIAAFMIWTDAESAGAHARLTNSSPLSGSALATMPAEISLEFSEPVVPGSVNLVLEREDGTSVALSAPVVDASGYHVQTTLDPSAPAQGAYQVRWSVRSAADGHDSAGLIAFTVGTGGTKTDASNANVNTAWRRIANNNLSGHHALVADLRGEDLTFTFRGTGIAWFTVKGPNQGRAAVFIDGVRKATYDQYATSTKYGVKRALSGLSDAVHTFRLMVLGRHHKGGKGNLVTTDRFLVS